MIKSDIQATIFHCETSICVGSLSLTGSNSKMKSRRQHFPSFQKAWDPDSSGKFVMSKKFLNVASSLNVHPPLPELRTLRYLRNRKHPPPPLTHAHSSYVKKTRERRQRYIVFYCTKFNSKVHLFYYKYQYCFML